MEDDLGILAFFLVFGYFSPGQFYDSFFHAVDDIHVVGRHDYRRTAYVYGRK